MSLPRTTPTMTPAGFFHGAPAALASAPGRVRLLGEYAEHGYVLPVATPQRTAVALSPSDDGVFHLYSETTGSIVSFARNAHAPPGFGSYIEGCVRMLEEGGALVPPLRVYVSTELPLRAGLSSSAALEVATLRALRCLLSLQIDDMALARLAQQAEARYARVQRGVLDQMTASLADRSHMLFIDARSLCYQLLALPPGCELAVIDAGIAQALAGTYQARRAECSTAARMLGLASLREVADPAQVDALAPPYRQRARHLVQENLRVLEAVGGVDGGRFGQLMDASHASLRDNFALATPDLDGLCTLLRNQPRVLGVRASGGGCVALCEQGSALGAARAVLAKLRAQRGGARQRARLLIPADSGTA